MGSLLFKLKLKEEFKIVLETDKESFIEKLKKNVESSDLDFMTEFFNSFKFSSKKSDRELKGIVLSNSFKLKQNISMNNLRHSIAVAEGKITTENGKLIIETVIKGFNYKMIPVCIFSFFIFLISIVALNIGNSEKAHIGLSILLLFISFIPYFKMRYGTKKLSELMKNGISKTFEK